MKKISIITINYNNLSGLKDTFASVLSQSGNDFEYIVIDGGSDDGSKELIGENTGHFAYSISEKDKGIYDAMNKGIEKAQGEYLLFINSGDTLAGSKTIENVLPLLQTNEDIIYGNLLINEGEKLTKGFMPDKIDLRQMMNDTLWHPVSFIKRNLFEKYGRYNTGYRIVGDYDFFFNVIISKKVSTKHIDEFIAVFDLNGMSSAPENIELIKKEREKVQLTYLTETEIQNFREEESRRLSTEKKSFFKKWFR